MAIKMARNKRILVLVKSIFLSRIAHCQSHIKGMPQAIFCIDINTNRDTK